MAISRLKRKPPASSELMAAELDQLGAQTNDLTTQIRRLSHQLHPDVLEHVGLVAALESEVAEFGHNEQIKMEFNADIKSEQIPLDVSVCLYRVAIEALRNVSRHSGATPPALPWRKMTLASRLKFRIRVRASMSKELNAEADWV